MERQTLVDQLASLPLRRIGVLGDFCLDAYWMVDFSASEPSIETGLPTHPVRRQRYSLGGAGNVVHNLRAMGVGIVRAFGVIGPDPFGAEMRGLLAAIQADVAGLLVQPEQWDTPVYIKPIREEREANRIDFGNFNHLHDGIARQLVQALEAALPQLDVVVVNEQLVHGIHTPFLREQLDALMRRHPEKMFIVDGRHVADVYAAGLHKLNAVEAVRLCGGAHGPDDVVSQVELTRAAETLFQRWRKPVFVTHGSRGCMVADAAGIHRVSGLHIVRKVDPVGAGDSMLAGVTAALSSGYAPADAATFGNFVAGVTVQKIFQTGTATPAEILAIGENPDYVYSPELADDIRSACYLQGTDIERVEDFPALRGITHVIFDHDGTLSTLRQGWEQVMEPVMIKAILGAHYVSADETTYARAVNRVRDFIDKTTGVQTLVQMEGLVEIVREFHQVPEADILDARGYKAIYNQALMSLVTDRMARLARHELDVADFCIKGAMALVRRLHVAGIKLYLASGTDEQDVVREAQAMEYAHLFEGRIYGAVGDVAVEAKKVVLDRILHDVGPQGITGLVAFGDGPVEIRETRKRGGLTVGVASDEMRRFGLNPSKRSRLIRAGAHLVVPDYSQLDALLQTLEIK
jgi:bifunctional ADP-heptose synthase (sugar kinase/adenylyltransferase)/phosphoglycolate phosphatase-like HAD superfamily hydrolase